MKFEDLITPFEPAEGPPPQTLGAFMRWCLSGAWPALWLAAVLSALAGGLEAGTAWILGAVIDTSISSGPEGIFQGSNLAMIFGALAFFLLGRPVLMGLSSASNAIIVQPNVNPLVLSRLHRWTLGQAVRFFDDDFAGRIAQKQMQAARAVTDVAVEMINVVAFALASLAGSLILLTTINPAVTLSFLVWLVAYFLLIAWFLPKIRLRSAARAGARAMVSGQVVDTITNIKTVKLFAHADFEDRAALGAMNTFRRRSLDFGYMAAGFRFCLMTLAGFLPVILIGGTLLLWRNGSASEGDIVAAGAVAIRIAQMTGWVSFTLMTIYSNLGEVEDGIRTLTPRIRIDDIQGAPDIEMAQGGIEFRDVSFAYGRQSGGISDINLSIAPVKSWASWGRQGRENPRSCPCC